MAGRVLEFRIPFTSDGYEKAGELVYAFDTENIIFKQVCTLNGSKLIYTKATTIMSRSSFLKGYEKLKENNYVCFRDHNEEVLMSIDVKVKFDTEGKRFIAADTRLYHLGRNVTSDFVITVDKMDLMFNEIIRNQRIMDNEDKDDECDLLMAGDGN
ncbi:hypothetical protein SALINJAH_274 [Bacillus phage SalinJah]|uniref:Uncharacterized protein n=1 Tax=Bacillus phage SalinJah TaxID=1837830 RepID=A0A173GC42_9CAUD|nr:hypothetical protein SALINJAH_274 [Bacillus phage SalinJah]ANH50830.1 hypothetical protein SALINJAH_274 [Bacillus phage SalinJah]